MAQSPTQRQSSSVKKAAASKPSDEPSAKKRQQGSLLDQELLALEKDDGKRHSREFSEYLLEHSRKIEELQEKNRRLEEELSFDDHVTRDDPFFNEQVADKLSSLYMQGNDFMIRLELERKEVARLNTLIQSHETTLAQQKSKLYELAALDHNHSILMGRIRKMENDIDRRIVKMNEKLNSNRKLRDKIDAHRMERARMDDIYTKTALEMLAKRHKVSRARDEVEQLRDEVAAAEKQLDNVRQEGDEWEQACDRRATEVLKELKEIALHHRDTEGIVDADKYKFLGESDLIRSRLAAQDSSTQARLKRSRKATQARANTDVVLTKYQENRTFIEKIHEVSGTTTVSEMIDAFNNQEAEHFDRIQQVNQLAEEIEKHRVIIAKLREEIGKLKQRKDSVEFQRMNRIETLRAKHQFTVEQKKHKEAGNQQLQAFLAALKPSIMLFHSRIGCPDVHTDSDLKNILGQIEEQIVVILQKYHTKTVSDQKDKTISSDVNVNTIPQPSMNTKREPSAVKARRSLMAGREDVRHPTSASDIAPLAATDVPQANTSPVQTTAASQTGGLPEANKPVNLKAITALLAKHQPYRYAGLRPPHMSIEELRKKDNVEEEYPLTYQELKSKVWQNDGTA